MRPSYLHWKGNNKGPDNWSSKSCIIASYPSVLPNPCMSAISNLDLYVGFETCHKLQMFFHSLTPWEVFTDLVNHAHCSPYLSKIYFLHKLLASLSYLHNHFIQAALVCLQILMPRPPLLLSLKTGPTLPSERPSFPYFHPSNNHLFGIQVSLCNRYDLTWMLYLNIKGFSLLKVSGSMELETFL